MSAKYPKHFIHASKPSYCANDLANATKIKSAFVIIWATLVKMLLYYSICNLFFFKFFVDRLLSELFKNVSFVCITLSILDTDFNMGKNALVKPNTVAHKKKINIYIYTVHLFL